MTVRPLHLKERFTLDLKAPHVYILFRIERWVEHEHLQPGCNDRMQDTYQVEYMFFWQLVYFLLIQKLSKLID